MPPQYRRQPILLDEVALHDALRRKGRPSDDDLVSLKGNNHSAPIPVSSPVRFNNFLLHPDAIRKQRGGVAPLFLDGNKLQRALTAKAEKRKVAQESTERRRQARDSMDRFIDASSAASTTNETYPKAFSKKKLSSRLLRKSARVQSEKASPSVQKKTAVVKTSMSDLYPTEPVSPRRQTMTKSLPKPPSSSASVGSGSTRKKTSSSPRQVKASMNTIPPRDPSASDLVASTITGDASRCSVTKKVVRKFERRVKKNGTDGSISTSNDSPAKKVHPMISKPSGIPPKFPRKGNQLLPARNPQLIAKSMDSETDEVSASPAHVINVKREKPGGEGADTVVRTKKKKPPSKHSIMTASTAKRSSDSVSTLEDPSVFSEFSDGLAPLAPTSNYSSLGTGSNHSHTTTTALQKRQPFSWSIRNETQTGFHPNEYITKETMTEYTENLGGVETVATTTKIFFDKAKHDSELNGYFRGTKWEHVRNEFIILANLQVPDSFDERIKGVLEHHCKFLENGANMERLITIWESAIEASWKDHHMDDPMMLIVVPSRVIFNLRALERHYAMHQKALRSEARAARTKGKKFSSSSRSGGILGRLRKDK